MKVLKHIVAAALIGNDHQKYGKLVKDIGARVE